MDYSCFSGKRYNLRVECLLRMHRVLDPVPHNKGKKSQMSSGRHWCIPAMCLARAMAVIHRDELAEGTSGKEVSGDRNRSQGCLSPTEPGSVNPMLPSTLLLPVHTSEVVQD